MVPISDCAGRCLLRSRDRLAVWFGVGLLLASTPSRASETVAIHAPAEELTPLARRLGSELVSAGYAVRFVSGEPEAHCEAGNAEPLWVSIVGAPNGDDHAIATLCFRGLAATVMGVRADPARFAVAAAEALNGLRAQPVVISEPTSRPAAAREHARLTPGTPIASPRARHARIGLSLAASLIADPDDFPVLWGASLNAAVPLSSRVHWVLAGFAPAVRAELSSPQAELRAGLAYLRTGFALHQTLGELGLSSSATGGAALIWVEADAKPPLIGGSAVAVSAIASVGFQLSYPEHKTLFVLSRAGATLLLPAGRIVVPSESTSTLGPLLLEASLGLGVRL